MKRVYLAGMVILIGLLIAFPTLTRSQSAPTATDLSWYTVDGGGATFSTGGPYSLGGTIGQPDAGVMSGGSYTLAGGFWGGTAINYNIYLPLVLKNS